MRPNDPHWNSKVLAPLIASPDSVDWASETDVIIVGFGGAGAAAALQSLELGLSVTALDIYGGGGATEASGGVIYAGGGTKTQIDAGVEDTPENMFNYLKLETENIVSDATLKDFCERSPETIDWLAGNGVDFRPTLWPHKTSYPAPEYFLYHSDNSLIERFQKHASPAARGHRGYVPVELGRKATGLGGSIFNPLKQSALAKGLDLLTYSEVRQLIVNQRGTVIGAKVLQFADETVKEEYLKLRAKAIGLMEKFPPIIPGSSYFLKKARKMFAQAAELEGERTEINNRARKGVVLSPGGFVFNSAMLAHYAPKYISGYPLGTDGDRGSGIRLGQSVGGKADNMSRVTAWRFINPPLSFTKGMVVNGAAKRVMDERVYGATMGVELAENHGGEGWLILDKAMVKTALEDVKGDKALSFQRALAKLNIYFGAKKAKTFEALAAKISMDPEALKDQALCYNALARGEGDDPFEKPAPDMQELMRPPFYAINIGLNAPLFPCPILTLGGLKVNEKTGQVLKETGNTPIKGLYAAGRNAVGICSWNYVSGLSIADCVYSGRRAARHLAKKTS